MLPPSWINHTVYRQKLGFSGVGRVSRVNVRIGVSVRIRVRFSFSDYLRSMRSTMQSDAVINNTLVRVHTD